MSLRMEIEKTIDPCNGIVHSVDSHAMWGGHTKCSLKFSTGYEPMPKLAKASGYVLMVIPKGKTPVTTCMACIAAGG